MTYGRGVFTPNSNSLSSVGRGSVWLCDQHNRTRAFMYIILCINLGTVYEWHLRPTGVIQA